MPDAASHDPHLNRDIAHSLGVAALACAASGGLLYLGYLAHTAWIAARSPHAPEVLGCVLVFGKRLEHGQPDADYCLRLRRAHALLAEDPSRVLVLLGGATGADRSEAEAGLRALCDWGLPDAAKVVLEDASQDTLQNLRHARGLLGEEATRPVLLLSNRYHLARCARLAAQLGFDYRLCAAEARLAPTPRVLLRLAVEAAYLCWLDIGTRWARLIGHRRMLARVS
jgi:uncharacterized SAM-binding protein YcdF (DUF218 family)